MTRKLEIFFLLIITHLGFSQNFSFADEKIKIGSVHICWNISFELAQDNIIGEDSEKTLDSIVKFLSDNLSVNIEIGQHCDKRGKPELNIKVTQKRADSIRDNLIKKGISSQRLVSKGYGSTRPYLTIGQEKERNHTSHPPHVPRDGRTTITVLRV